jgi:hypothetical protein
LRLWNFHFPANPGKTICPGALSGYCALGWTGNIYDFVLLMDFWLLAFNSPNANNISSPRLKHRDFPGSLGCGRGERKIPRLSGAKSAMMSLLSWLPLQIREILGGKAELAESREHSP